MNKADNFGRAYQRLALEIEKHVPGYIDSFIGSAELKAEVEAAEKKTPAALLDDLSWLQANLPAGDPNRRAYMQATLRALDCTLQQLNGQQFDYFDEANRLYDIQLHLIDESRFTAAHRELDTLLPGPGSITDRLDARRKRYEITNDQALPLIELARDEARRRTLALMELVEGESLEVTLVSDQPWGAYNWYKGNYRSLIEFNTDLPLNAMGLLGTFAHEGYPGHHTEQILKDKLLYQEKGYDEEAVRLLNAPQAVIAEAIATTASEIIFPNESDDDWNAQVLLPAAGLTPEPVEQTRRIAHAGRELRYVSGNAAILYHTGQLNQEQTIDYLRTYGLSTEQRARQSFRFITAPLNRSYSFTYSWGYDLLAQATNGGDKYPLFYRLLTEQMLPSQLISDFGF